MDGFPTPDPATVFPEGLEPNQEDNEKRSLNKLVGLSQLILTALQGGLSVSWGSITGTLSNQTDLQAELDVRPERAAPQLVESTEGATISFVNSSQDQNISDIGADIDNLNVLFPENSVSVIGQLLTYSRGGAIAVLLDFQQTGGGTLFRLGSQQYSPAAVVSGLWSITWQKVDENTWSAVHITGVLTPF
jgi:hypothetical protein